MKFKILNKIKKILILSDTHGDEKKYKKIIKKQNADIVIHAGDYWDTKSLKFDFKTFNKKVDFFIKGNHGIKNENIKKCEKLVSKDEFTKAYRTKFILQKLKKDYLLLNINGFNFLVVHILREPKWDYFFDPSYYDYKKWLANLVRKNKIQYLIFGHTHHAEISDNSKNEESGLHFANFVALNPGSLTKPQNQKYGSYIVAHFKNKKWAFKIEYIK